MIVTVTPNPGVDRTLELATLARGEVLRAGGRRVDPGGKGSNVARALHACGVPVGAVFLSGGPEGAEAAAVGATWVVGSASLLAGAGDDLYAAHLECTSEPIPRRERP